MADALNSLRSGRYDLLAYLRRVAYSTRGYLDREIGPLPNGNTINYIHVFKLNYIMIGLPTEIIRDLDVQDLRLNIQPRLPAPPMHVRGVRRPRGRGRQMLERPGPAGLIPRVADNLNAFGNNY